MKSILLILSFLIIIYLNNLKGQTIYVSGVINSDSIWNVDTVFLEGSLLIDTNATLYIYPNTKIISIGYQKIQVLGSIIAIGGVNEPIRFTINSNENFKDTTTNDGGWEGFIFNNSMSKNSKSSIFENCVFEYGKNVDIYENLSNEGIIYSNNYDSLIFRNCLFKNNMVFCTSDLFGVGKGGAIHADSIDFIEIDNCIFERNRSTGGGGAIYIGKSHKTIIHKNIFKDNEAFQYILGWYGGAGSGIYCSEPFDSNYYPEIYNNLCYNNRSPDGIIYTSNLHAKIYNNVICNNNGGGISDGHELSRTNIFNNTIVNNKGTGITLFSRAFVYNNICWSNINPYFFTWDQIYVHGNAELFNNCVQYGDGGDNAVYEMPLFLNPTDEIGYMENYSADWALLDNSSCVNQGTNDTNGLFIPDIDFYNNQRIFGNRIDIGAIENQVVISTISFLDNYNFLLTPNPTNEFFKIFKAVQVAEAEFILYNSLGQIVLQKTLSESTTEIDISALSNGLYVYNIFVDGKLDDEGKVVVE